MLKIPYGISDFATLRREGYLYQDRTDYIRSMEGFGERYLTYLRPRRFGKSLWLSTLAHYYGREHAGAFAQLFSELDIHRQPTPEQGRYLILYFDFSKIETSTRLTTREGFNESVRKGIMEFLASYPEELSSLDREEVFANPEAITMISRLFTQLANPAIDYPVYLLIDEYDHFTNELISFDLDHFQEIVTGTGWVRKFYESIKTATGKGTVSRIFMTGVSPVTLDSLTSGYNIGSNLSKDPRLGGLMGFTAAECKSILGKIGVDEQDVPGIMADLQSWYNGYCFVPEGGRESLFNPDMVLYFAKEYQHRGTYPKDMLDINIASDYGKIRQLFRLGGREKVHFQLLNRLLEVGYIRTPLTESFSFEKTFTDVDFLSLLYYMGMLTIKGEKLGIPLLGIPNKVVEALYYGYFRDLMNRHMEAIPEELEVQDKVLQLAENNDPSPFLHLIASTLKALSKRDFLQFTECSLKAIFVSYLHASQLYLIQSEPENRSGYADLLLLRREPFPAPYQFVFELKYLKKKNAYQLKAKVEEGRMQLQGYLREEPLRSLPDLKAWLVVFAGNGIVHVEEVK
jgi:hypothetical protein